MLTAKQEAFAQAYQKCKKFNQAAASVGLEASNGCGYYVYFLVDPTSQEIFYVGKGKGRRASSHVKQALQGVVANAEKHKRILKILSEGLKVQEFIFGHYEIERDAFACERFFIKALSNFGLSNIAGGVMTNEEKVSEEAKFLITQLVPESWFYRHGNTEMQKAIESTFGSFKAYDEFVRGVLNSLIVRSKVDVTRGVSNG